MRKSTDRAIENAPLVQIQYSAEWHDYRVPGRCGTEAGAYYTDTWEDAVSTARAMYGRDTRIIRKNGA